MLWLPTKAEIQDWVDFKALEFAQEESKGSWLNPTEWLGQYLYTDIHEIFLFEFLLCCMSGFQSWKPNKEIFKEENRWSGILS